MEGTRAARQQRNALLLDQETVYESILEAKPRAAQFDFYICPKPVLANKMIGDVSEAGKEGWTVSQDRGVSDLLRPLLRSSVRLSEIVRPVCSRGEIPYTSTYIQSNQAEARRGLVFEFESDSKR